MWTFPLSFRIDGHFWRDLDFYGGFWRSTDFWQGIAH